MSDTRDRTQQAVRMYANDVWRTCVVYLGRGQDAEDAFQSTFLKHLTHTGEFTSSEHEKAWLIRVAANTCKDFLKKSSRRDSGIDESTYDVPDEQGWQMPGDARSEVLDALFKLPPDQRFAMYLTAVMEYPATDAAKIMGKPANTVYSLIHRARRSLKEALS